MILGAFGVIFGNNAHFTLPPILGGLPFFLGWAMCVGLIKYWRLSARLKHDNRPSTPSTFCGPTDTVDPTYSPGLARDEQTDRMGS